MEINKIHHINFLDNTLEDKCANLIIADPPYFEVKGAFDFIWKSFDDYLIDVEKWAVECKRILADNGTLFIYGDRKIIAYVQVIFDKYFNLENHIVWKKPMSFTEAFDTLRSFPNRCFERVLMYSNEVERTGWEEVKHGKENFHSIKTYLDNEKQKAGLSNKQLNELMGTATNGGGRAATYFGYSTEEKEVLLWLLPTEERYTAMQKSGFFQKPYNELRQEYEQLRQEYESKRRPFDNFLKLTDCWEFTNGNPSLHDHDTVKPEKMTRAIIITCSRPKDLVVIPFAGSGTECSMAAKEGRNFIGFEIEEKYVEMGNKRAENIRKQPTLFYAHE